MEISDIHDDLLNNILIRLPAEALGRSKCVSKSWNALISCDKFIKSHQNHHSLILRKKLNILVPEFHEIKLFEFSIEEDTKSTVKLSGLHDCESKRLIYLPELLDARQIIQIVGSSNGLLCLKLRHDSDSCVTCHRSCDKLDRCPFPDGDFFCFCNPLTKSIWDLPMQFRLHHRCSLFWYDDVNDDYKFAILMVHFGEVKFDVYSRRSNSWSSIYPCMYSASICCHRHVPENIVLLNCALHCIFTDMYSIQFILAIDVRTSKSKILPLPEAAKKTKYLNLTKLNGNLVLSDSCSNDKYKLWLLRDYGLNDSWTQIAVRKISVNLLIPVALLENDFNHTRLLVSFNSKDKMLEINDLNESDDVGGIQISAPYLSYGAKQLEFVGSLVKPYPPSVEYTGYHNVDVHSPFTFTKKLHIYVNGKSLDSRFRKHVRRKYYELCSIKKSFLHEQLVPGVRTKLAARMIKKVVNIADSIRSCEFHTLSRDEIKDWMESLRSFELLGMNVGFLRDHICCLLVALDSEEAIEAKKYWEVESRKAEIEKEIESLEEKIVKLKDEGKKYDAEMDVLKPKAKSCELMFQHVRNLL